MQPLRLSLEGNYWDSQIYSGRLYLWDMDGALTVLNWDSLVDSITPKSERTTFQLALKNADYLYAYDLGLLYGLGGVRQLVVKHFENAANRDIITLSTADLAKHQINKVDTPFKSLHDDCEFYNNDVYGLTDSGLLQFGIRPKNKSGFTKSSAKLADIRGTAIRAKRNSFAIAALSDGLYEWSGYTLRLSHVAERPTAWLDWMFASVYCSSEQGSYMAAYHYEDRRPVGSWTAQDDAELANEDDDDDTPDWVPRRKFNGFVSSEEIFGNNGLSWGIEDKAYLARGNVLEAVSFQHRRLKSEPNELSTAFNELPTIPFDAWKGRIIRGGAAYFGTVVELENALVVLGSDGQNRTFPGPITRWRVFPRSLRYENQLHLVCERSLEVVAFTHDWFVDQDAKVAGTRHWPGQKGYMSAFRR